MASETRSEDKLEKAAVAARQAGMSYGQWMALQNPVNIVKPKPVEVVPDFERIGYVRVACQYCSKEFEKLKNTRQIYCGRPCRDAASYYRKLRREIERKKESC